MVSRPEQGELTVETNIDDQFNLRKRHPFAQYYLVVNYGQSLAAQLALKCHLDISYGESPGQKLDIFPAQTENAPVFVFIHGGYFRSLDKRHYRYVAFRQARSGHTTVLLNYDLSPQVRVADIIQQMLTAFGWIKKNIHQWNGDPHRLILCGHSVGAFLVAKILQVDWPNDSGIQKAVLLSGLYDLGPMKQCYLNRDLQLTDSDVANLSPQFGSLVQTPDILIAVGKQETEQFIFQSQRFSHKLRDEGIKNTLLILPHINHYTMSRLLVQSDNPVTDWITRDRDHAQLTI